MNERDKLSDRLRDLIDDYLDGRLDEAQTQELDALLCADAGARHYLIRFARLHTDLYLESRAQQAGARALERLAQQDMESRAYESTNGKFIDSSNSMPADGPFASRSRFQTSRVIAIAACLALAIGTGWWLVSGRPASGDRSRHEPTIAWLVNAQNCQWLEAEPAGDMQAGRTLKLQRGLAEIRFLCGARVVLAGPASLELLSGKSARLKHGRLTARVPGPANGFEIVSPQGKVIDLGTEFGVDVSDNGTTSVFVFEGKVEAHSASAGEVSSVGMSLTSNQAAQIVAGKVERRPVGAVGGANQFVRAIVPPPAIVPRVFRLTFNNSIDGTINDTTGKGTGLMHRLPGTGSRLRAHDPNLRLDTAKGQLELTTTRSDIRNQVRLWQGEYLGVRLSDLGFTGEEDFAVTATIPNTPALEDYGQFGLYAGTWSDRNIRGGLIKWGRQDPGQNTQFMVNNNGGPDTDLYKVGLLSPGTTLRLTLKRIGGEYSLTVENRTDGGASTLTIRNPEFLSGEPDLYVGLFGANPYSDVRKTLIIKEFSVTVWTLSTSAKRSD